MQDKATFVAIPCTGCGHTDLASQESFRVFQATAPDANHENANGAFAGMAGSPKPHGGVSFSDLPHWMKRKFQAAGLGNGRGVRTLAEAEEFFRSSVPTDIRNMGVKAIEEFLSDKVASHKESFANAPGKAKMPGNIVWEKRLPNLKRGSANMKVGDRLHAHASNGTRNAKLVGQHALRSAGKAAAFAAVTELLVSASEGAIHVAKGKKSKESAAKETATSVAKSGVTGGVVAAGVAAATVFGAGPALAVIYPVAAPAGVALYGYQAIRRIRKAAQDSPPPLHFHFRCTACGRNNCYYEA